jgi:hypothetical protein
MNATITETRELANQILHRLDQARLIITHLRLITLAGSRLTDRPTRPAFTHLEHMREMRDRRPFARRA